MIRRLIQDSIVASVLEAERLPSAERRRAIATLRLRCALLFFFVSFRLPKAWVRPKRCCST